jgi:dolichol-phosphate mannosyltransferase
MYGTLKVAVVIPTYRAGAHVVGVISAIPDFVDHIIVVDDACPDGTAAIVNANAQDLRIQLVTHSVNQGVGGAMITGYRKALELEADIVAKIDSDGQMDPLLLETFIKPIANGQADYAKGNRFFEVEFLECMPLVRLIGNSVLSIISKMASGYWGLMDPTNGYTAIHKKVLQRLPLDKIDKRYFFESDMLFRLGILRACVHDVPMRAVYGEERSNLKISNVMLSFPGKYFASFCKRIFYTYFLRDFNAGSVQGLLGLMLLSFGSIIGVWHWLASIQSGHVASSGTVMLAALPIMLGGHFLISALNYDIAHSPNKAIHVQLS